MSALATPVGHVLRRDLGGPLARDRGTAALGLRAAGHLTGSASGSLIISCISSSPLCSARRLVASATLVRTGFFPVTRGATPARTLRCVSRPGCGRTEEERRPAGAGLGDATLAKVSAEAVGQPSGRRAAPPAATVGSGGEWSQKWRVPRGSPDWRPRPPVLLLLTLLELGLVPGGRREELSASSAL